MSKLNIVDEDGNIIGEEERSVIHEKGLLHREINVWFYTSTGGLIFQHRAKDKETFPDLLDATVGGHVEIGENYEMTAVKEIKEETGLVLGKEELEFISFKRVKIEDKITGKINNVIKKIFAYRYDEDIKSLKVEKEEGAGFEFLSFEKLLNLNEEGRKKIVPFILSADLILALQKHSQNRNS